jgi:hypothetical protein
MTDPRARSPIAVALGNASTRDARPISVRKLEAGSSPKPMKPVPSVIRQRKAAVPVRMIANTLSHRLRETEQIIQPVLVVVVDHKHMLVRVAIKVDRTRSFWDTNTSKGVT